MTPASTVADERDRIQQVPDTAGWTENLLFQTFDVQAGVALWAHWGRMSQAPSIWEAAFVVFLPGQRLLVSRSFGPSPHQDRASSGSASFRCMRPGKSWHVSFDGMARPATPADMAAGVLGDGHHERLMADLAFTAVHPLWIPTDDLTSQTWAQAHLEQGGRVTGRIEHDRTSIDIDASGFRDHSYGPRDTAGLLGDTWCSGVFPSGRAVLAFEVWQREGPGLSAAFVWKDNGLHDATANPLPRLAGHTPAPGGLTLELTTPARVEHISVEYDMPMTWTLDRPVGMTAGARVDGSDGILLTESPARLTWDGETAGGWVERSLRPSGIEPEHQHKGVP